MPESSPDLTNGQNQIPAGRIENWDKGFKTVVGQDPENKGKTLGVIDIDGTFYPFENDEEFIQKPLSDPQPFIRTNHDPNQDLAFKDWLREK